MMNIRKILVLGMVITQATAGLAWGAEPIKIGSVLRLSIGAEHDISSKRGVEMAVDEVNKAGGINGRKGGSDIRRREGLPRGVGECGAETHQRGQSGGPGGPHDLRRRRGGIARRAVRSRALSTHSFRIGSIFLTISSRFIEVYPFLLVPGFF